MSTSTASFVVTGALGIVFLLAAVPQLGQVVKAQKISDTSGGFTAELEEQDQFGRAIVNLGDLDGDGITDLLVGAHTDDDGVLGGLDRGSVYILFLRANGFVKSWQKISDLYGNFSGHLDPSDQFGRAAACLGDLDGDGVVDVAVSSNYDDDGGTNRGAIYILFLNTDGTVKSTQKISSTQGGLPNVLKMHDEFGRSITSLGDLDGDGVTDVVVGTPEDDDGGTNTGALHVLFLNTNGTVKSYRRISRSTDGLRLRPGDWFGHCSANLGDFDGDGVTDLVVGSVLDDDGGVNQGSIWILFLNADGSVKEAHEINEVEGGFTAQLDDIDQFGTSVTALGDLDGDGITDIAVGAVLDDDGGPPGDPDADVGAVYVLFLNANATVKSWVKVSDTSGDLPYPLDEGDWFGCALGRLGGSPLDGLFNVAIGGRYDNDGGGNHGSIYLVQLNDGTAPVADFLADRTLGVAPMTVNFTDTSAGEVTARLWNLSDPPQSTETDPVKTFTTPGTYDIQLTAKGPKGTDVLVKHDYITVSAGPLADFAAATTEGVAPVLVSFSDLSEGSVTSWSWDFGDGSTSTGAHPQHSYVNQGTYTVSLTATGPNGTSTKTRTSLITVEGTVPAADFTAATTCGFAPLAVEFTDLSTGTVSGCSWSFGDGASANVANPQHVYTTPGVYTVQLTVSGPNGVDTEIKSGYVVVDSPVPAASFDAQPPSGFSPLAVGFTDQSTGNVTAWSWDFGDGFGSTAANPVHVFDLVGTYSVRLTVTGPAGTSTQTRSNLIEVGEPPPVAEFLASSTLGFAPFTAEFTDQSSGIVTQRLWSFGDGVSSSLANPAHVYSAPGIYAVSLTVRGPAGTDTETKLDWITVKDPSLQAGFDAAPTAGIAPLTVQFTDLSNGLITGRLWSFGDGSTSTAIHPEHVFTSAGTFAVSLTISGPAGTSVESKAGFVQVSEAPPAAEFQATPSAGLVPLAVQFTDQSGGTISSRLWNFGDGASSTEANPVHVFTVPGTFTVTLALTGPAGTDTRIKAGLITVAVPPPTPEFTAGPTVGFAPLPVAFTDLSAGSITSWTWNFGDGSSSRARFPVKAYTRAGNFTVTLTVKGPGGTRSVSHGGITISLPPSLADGGFELQRAGSAPASPWNVIAGSAHLIRSNSVAGDGGMPSDGSLWCELGAAGTSGATPPSNPLGTGQWPVGAAGIERSFAFQPLAPHLLFDAAFLLGDAEDSQLANDFMSVDLSDGTTSWNVFHADTFSEFPNTSTLHGFRMTAVQRVHVDLRTLFPTATNATLLTLRVSVGNAGDGLDPSLGYVDAFRLVPQATATFRNGTGRNATRYQSSPAVLGGSWTIQVDTTGHAAQRMIQLVGMQRPASGTIKAQGELLISGKTLFSQSWPATSGLNVRTVALPLDLTLVGQFMTTQVTITGGATELCNAYDLLLGF